MGEVLKNIELIEKYFEGTLSDDARKDFETRMTIDPDFKSEVELYKNVVNGIKGAGAEKLKLKLKEADRKLDKTNVQLPVKSKWSLYGVAAASILLLVSLGIWYFLQSQENLPKLADKYYEKDIGLPVTMGRNSGYTEWTNKYKGNDFDGAMDDINSLLSTQPYNDTLLYYAGIIKFEMANYAEATEHFLKIQSNSAFFQRAEFRLILCYLKSNDKGKALEFISRVRKNKGHLFYSKVNSLSQELSSE